MTDTFTVSINGTETTRSDGYDAELNALALGPGLYSNSLAFGYCYDIVCYCEVDNCKLHFDIPQSKSLCVLMAPQTSGVSPSGEQFTLSAQTQNLHELSISSTNGLSLNVSKTSTRHTPTPAPKM